MLRWMILQSVVFSAITIGIFAVLFLVPITRTGTEFRVMTLVSGVSALGLPALLAYLWKRMMGQSARSCLVYGLAFSLVNLLLWVTILLVALRASLTWAA